MANIRNFKESYADHLSRTDWDFFCTLTTGYSLTMKSARRLMGNLHDRTSNYGGSQMFWVAEPFDTREGYHTHSLIRLNDRSYKDIENDGRSADFELLRESWTIVRGRSKKGYSDFERYNPALGAAGYVGKYIMKQHSDYDLLY